MATTPRYYRTGLQRALSGLIDLDGVDLALSLYPSTLDAAAINVDSGHTDFTNIVTAALTTINIPVADRSWVYDTPSRTLILKTANILTYTPGATQTMRYAVLHVNSGPTKDLIALYDYLTDQTLTAAVAQDFDIRNLLEFRMFSSLTPAPIATDALPVRDASPDGTVWRILSNGIGALITVPTSETAPTGLTYLTAPDASKWAFSVDNTGAVAAVSGVPGVNDTVYAAGALRVPSTDPAEIYQVDVSNAGVLSTTLVP